MSRLSWRVKLMALIVVILGTLLLVQIFYVVPYIEDQAVETTGAQQEDCAHNIARELDNYIELLL